MEFPSGLLNTVPLETPVNYKKIFLLLKYKFSWYNLINDFSSSNSICMNLIPYCKSVTVIVHWAICINKGIFLWGSAHCALGSFPAGVWADVIQCP